MAKLLTPLAPNVPIVDKEGNPNPYFQRIMQELTDARVSASLIDALGGDPDEDAFVMWDDTTGDLTFYSINDLADLLDISELLDTIDDTHGAILYRDSSDWQALAPGTDGDVLTTHGAGSDPTWETPSGGGGGSGLTPPVLADFPTQLSIGAETFLADTDEGLAFNVGTGGAGTVVRCILKTMPTPPFSVVFKIDACSENTASDGMGLIIRDSASGRLLKFGFNLNVVAGQVIVERWTNNTTFSAASKTTSNVGVLPYLKVTDNNTNLIYEYALTKEGPWMPFFSEGRTAWLAAADQIGFGIEDQNLVTYMMLVKHYEQA